MDTNGEDKPASFKGSQLTSPWVPVTPAKTGSSQQQQRPPISPIWQENHPDRSSWLEPGILTRVSQFTQENGFKPAKLPGEFLAQLPHHTALGCYSPINYGGESSINSINGDFNIWQAGDVRDPLQGIGTWQASEVNDPNIYGANVLADDKFSIADSEPWNNMSFGTLLSMAHTASNAPPLAKNDVTLSDFTSTSNTFSPRFHPSIGIIQHTTSFRNSSGPELDSSLGPTVGKTIPSRPFFFDLNAPPRITENAALSESIAFQFEPITPEMTKQVEYRQELSLQNLSRNDEPLVRDAPENMPSGAVKGHHEKKQKTAVGQMRATSVTQGQEKNKPDKGCTEEADSIKTPQQKPRRRKHRPKVIIEDQTKSNPRRGRQTSVSEETTIKKTYVRRKGTNHLSNPPAEDGKNETGSNMDKSTSKHNPAEKRKHVKRKGLDELEATMEKGSNRSKDLNTTQLTRRSCRRSLNFTSEGLMEDCGMESQAENFKAKLMEKRLNDLNVSHDRTNSTDQAMEGYLSGPEKDSSSHLQPTKRDPLPDYWLTAQNPTKGKCQIVFSDVTHDKEANTIRVIADPHNQQAPQNYSICSGTNFSQEREAKVLKRQHTSTSAEAEVCSSNATRKFQNFKESYLSLFSQNSCTSGMHFPNIYKKKRTDKVFGAANSSLQHAMTAFGNQAKLGKHTISHSLALLFTSRTNHGSFIALKAADSLMNSHSTDGTRTGQRIPRDLLPFRHTGSITRKRSKGNTRVRDLASLQQLCKRLPSSPSRAARISQSERRNEIVHRPRTCMEALVADTHSTIMTKKRSKRALTVQNVFTHHEFASTSNGSPLALTWKSINSIDAIIDQLHRLDLNAQVSQVLAQKRKAFAYHMHYQEQSALVPYQRGGVLIPFDGSFDQFRRRRPRPKVNLDEETTRVWKLLLEDINSEGIDGKDEDKTRWWEEERRVFKGRADSFIARMHLVQGDRRFSPWKGSVVDSVIGVFLTQNVSDHLSSSAFMSVAARFPPSSETGAAEFPEDKLQTEASLPEVCMQDADEPSGLNKILIEPVHGSDSKMPHDLKDEIRLVNSLESSGNSSEDSVAIDILNGQLPDMSNSDPIMSHESAPNKSMHLIGNGLDTDDALSSQNSADSPNAQTNEIMESSSLSNSEVIASEGKLDSFTSSTSFVKLLQMAGTVLHGVYTEGLGTIELHRNEKVQSEIIAPKSKNEHHYMDHISSHKPNISCSEDTLFTTPSLGADAGCLGLSNKYCKLSDTSIEGHCTDEISGLSVEFASQPTLMQFPACSSQEGPKYLSREAHTSKNDKIEVNRNISQKQTGQREAQILLQETGYKKHNSKVQSKYLIGSIGSSSNIGNSRRSEHKEVKLDKNDPDYYSGRNSSGSMPKGGRIGKEKHNPVDWDSLRKQAEEGGRKRERTANTMDSVDWDAVRCADVDEIAQTIKERGMNNMLAERIKAFLNRLVREHGSIDLEWLRDVPPDKAKEYLLSIRGLGLKSVECVRLLTLHHLAFPVDTNVGRIAVRLGWVPLQPLPESLQLHLLELYPVLESIQKYLWPRLCKLDQRTLYELHYQMITFGKVFCTKSKPNCNACPLRAECRHFASAFASARLALPAPEEKNIVKVTENLEDGQDPIREMNILQLPSTLPVKSIPPAAENKAACQISVRATNNLQLYSYQANATDTKSGVSHSQPIIEEPTSPEPTVEMPTTPETECSQVPEYDIEDTFCEDLDEIPTINFNVEQFTQNLQKVMRYTETEEGDMSKALVAMTPEAASIPVPKLKNVSRLRTEHQVYELPDSHPLLEGTDKREPDDPSPYLLAIWTPGETVDSIKPPERRCGFQETGKLCTEETCLSCNSIREQKSQIVRGTLLIPCRTAMRGSFPLNGTYFQVNEVFSDHESSMNPIDVPRQWLWNMPRRTVYFGTSIPTIFKGLTTAGIQYCFWRGFVCVRGFDRDTRAPRPLGARFHFPASKLARGKGKIYDE